MTAHPGKEAELQRHLLVLVEHTRREEGCIQYDLHVSPSDPCQFLFVENWITAEALDRHANSPHMHAFRQVSADLRADPVVRTYTRIA
jgi:quinol monooxygenase YgiN